MRKVIRQIAPHVILVRNGLTGIATVLDHTAGVGHSAHPNIAASGSTRGMRAKGFWGKKDRVVESDGFKYNIDILHVSDDYDVIAARACQCGGNHGIHEGKAPGGKKRHAGGRWYVGPKIEKGWRFEPFIAARKPTHASHGKKYGYSIGPFRSKGGAAVMARYGAGNPHLQTVSEAEKMAKREKASGNLDNIIAEVNAMMKG